MDSCLSGVSVQLNAVLTRAASYWCCPMLTLEATPARDGGGLPVDPLGNAVLEYGFSTHEDEK